MKLDERQAISRLIDTFGAEVLINMREFTPLAPIPTARARLVALDQVATCQRCDLRGTCIQPVEPEFSVANLSRVLVIGESPTQDDDHANRPFTGRVGTMVRNQLFSCGLDPDHCSYTYVVSCRCHDGHQPLPPSVAEQAKCRDNLLTTISASNAEYILLLGMTAIRAWRDDVKVNQVAGKLFVWGERFVYPMYSYQAVLRTAFPAATWREQLVRFAGIVLERQGLAALETKCLECGDTVHGYDQHGCSWCREHLPMHIGKLATQGRRWARNQPNQEGLGV